MQENTEPHIVTQLLEEAARGNRDALDRLLPLVYDELRRLAHARLRSERDDHTLNTTALVHECYVKLVDQSRVEWRNRSHFFAVSSEAMRRILVDYARRRNAAKRGSGAEHLADSFDSGAIIPDPGFSEEEADQLVALDEALHRLATFNANGARVVQYKFFGGLSYDEIAEVMGGSPRTARRSWTVAKAWLRNEVSNFAEGGGGRWMPHAGSE